VSRPVQLSTGLPSFAADDPGDWGHLLDAARLCDAAGVDRVVVSDHVVFGEDLDDYGEPRLGGQAGGRQPTGPDGHWLEPLTTLSVLAGMTTRVRLGTNILLAALRRPVVLAKSAATLDVLSGGRLDLGVGVGWQRAEYDAAGLDFARRGALLDETLEACRSLWRDRVAHLRLPGPDGAGREPVGPVHMMPKPRQPGGVPIWVSGTVNPRVVRRVARFGAGWLPWGPDAVDPAAIGRMRRAVAEAGGPADELQVAWALRSRRTPDGAIDADRTAEAVPALVAAGATDLRVRLRATDMTSATLEALVASVRAAAATVTGTGTGTEPGAQ
jgi:probable F420-dependent oxidoreductase